MRYWALNDNVSSVGFDLMKNVSLKIIQRCSFQRDPEKGGRRGGGEEGEAAYFSRDIGMRMAA